MHGCTMIFIWAVLVFVEVSIFIVNLMIIITCLLYLGMVVWQSKTSLGFPTKLMVLTVVSKLVVMIAILMVSGIDKINLNKLAKKILIGIGWFNYISEIAKYIVNICDFFFILFFAIIKLSLINISIPRCSFSLSDIFVSYSM